MLPLGVYEFSEFAEDPGSYPILRLRFGGICKTILSGEDITALF